MFKVGSTVKIKVCNFNGLIVLKRTTDGIAEYEVTFPNEHGLPVSRWFAEIELEDAQNNTFGFGITW